jgi:hypothetical protein
VRQQPHNAVWPAVVGVVAVAASTLALLLAGQPLQDAVIGGTGIALIGAEVARRVVRDAGIGPTGIVAGVVSGLVGLVAGELAGRLADADRRSRTEV